MSGSFPNGLDFDSIPSQANWPTNPRYLLKVPSKARVVFVLWRLSRQRMFTTTLVLRAHQHMAITSTGEHVSVELDTDTMLDAVLAKYQPMASWFGLMIAGVSFERKGIDKLNRVAYEIRLTVR